jgi:two-component system chemotaxis response regulator CheB
LPERRPALSAAASGPPIRAVAVGASTGGPAALQRVLSELPADFAPSVLIVQHISKGFLGGLMQWLGAACPLAVKIAEDGERLKPSTVYIAPDDRHLGVAGGARILLDDGPPIGGFRPSATFLFDSVAKGLGAASLHVILTGMGRDGVTGLEAAHAAGATIIAQDEASSVIFGMPGAAIQSGVVDRILPLEAIAAEIRSLATLRRTAE